MSAVRWCNGIAAVLHLVSLIAVFAIGFKPETIQRTTWELKQDTVSIRIQDAGPAAAAGVCDTAPPNTFSFGDTVLDVSTFPGRAAWAKLSLFWLVVGFFALSGVFQGGVELSGLLWWMKGEGIYDKMFPDGVTQAAVVSEVVGLPVAHGSVGQAPSADPAVRPPGTGAVLPLPQAAALLRRRHLVWAGAKGGAVPMTPTARVDKCTVYINWLRYVEYSISATVMLVSISLVAGVNDLDVLVCMSIMCGSCMLLGMVAEYSFRMHIFLKSMPRDDDGVLKWLSDVCAICYRTSHAIAWVLIAGPWYVIVKRYMQWWGGCGGADRQPPDFVQIIVVAQGGLFLAFGLVQVFQFFCPSRRLEAELLYIALGLISKAVLGGLLLL